MTLPFENDTTKVVNRLAKRSLQADKQRNFFVIITIILTTALLSGMFFIVLASQRKLESEICGQYQAVVIDTTQAEIAHLSAQPEIEQWGLSQNFGTARYKDSNLVVEYADENWMALGKKPPYTGDFPQAENEILVERVFLNYFGLPQETGQTIRLNLGNGEQEYMISGILQAENTSRMFSVIVSRAFLEAQADGEPLFEFRFRFEGANRADLDALKTDIAAFLKKIASRKIGCFTVPTILICVGSEITVSIYISLSHWFSWQPVVWSFTVFSLSLFGVNFGNTDG